MSNIRRENKIDIFKEPNQNGYAILFSVIMISVISTITIGLLNSTYKQLILSSLARDSQTAFYESDIATECALYSDIVKNRGEDPFIDGESWSCGNFLLDVNLSSDGYVLNTTDPESTDPCFNIIVTKTDNGDGTLSTKTRSKGYNICDRSNKRTVEREIEMNY